MTITAISTPVTVARVYVGTYGKYNAGSIAGGWVDLEQFGDADEFLAHCRAMHADEHDPEFMFQDFEGFPRGFYNESCISPELWDWLAMDEDDRQLLDIYQEGVDQNGTIEDARDAYHGTADTEADFAAQYYEDAGMLQDVPAHIANYIDWDAVARDMRLGGDFVFVRYGHELHVFANQ